MCTYRKFLLLATSPSIGRGILLRTKEQTGSLHESSVRGIARTQTRWASSSTPLLLGNLDDDFHRRQCQRSMEETDFLIMAHHYSKASQDFLLHTLKSPKDILWPLKLALVHPTNSPGLFTCLVLASVHLYLSIPKVCQGPSHLRTLAHSVSTAWDTLHRTSCSTSHGWYHLICSSIF